MQSILDQYIKQAPNAQDTVNLFENEWSTKLPAVDGLSLKSGGAELFNDSRITVMNELFPLADRRILELGPLEAAHTFMMEQCNPLEIVSVESNARAFLKCLIVKELYHMKKSNFLLGDAVLYMQTCSRKFDICLASGILYHSASPGQFIKAMSQVSDKLFIWTHFYDENAIKGKQEVYKKFREKELETIDGFTFEKHKYEYGESLDWDGFCGGSEAFTTWITKPSLIQLLELFGYKKINIVFEDITHQNGPNICLLAERF